jgi:hypothetical protein
MLIGRNRDAARIDAAELGEFGLLMDGRGLVSLRRAGSVEAGIDVMAGRPAGVPSMIGQTTHYWG